MKEKELRLAKVLILIPFLLPSLASAGAWEEREYLERYVAQLQSLNDNLLMDAKKAADPTLRLQLNYEALTKDANEIINKVNHHLYTPLDPFSNTGTGDEGDE